MPKINTAVDTKEKANNCALCTAAALTGQTSGDVNVDLQTRCPAVQWGQFESDRAFIEYARNEPVARGLRKIMADPDDQVLADQIIGLASYIEWKLNTAVRYHGFPDDKKTAAPALPFTDPPERPGRPHGRAQQVGQEGYHHVAESRRDRCAGRAAAAHAVVSLRGRGLRTITRRE